MHRHVDDAIMWIMSCGCHHVDDVDGYTIFWSHFGKYAMSFSSAKWPKYAFWDDLSFSYLVSINNQTLSGLRMSQHVLSSVSKDYHL